MKKYKNKITFGFEIEGLFDGSVWEKLLNLSPGSRAKLDGSVRIPISGGRAGSLKTGSLLLSDDDNGWIATELNSGVFNSYPEMIKALKLFNKENYTQNSTCGIHVHLGFGKDKIAGAKIASRKFIDKLQEYAQQNLCVHIQDRLRNGHFCELTKTTQPKHFLDDWYYNEKYRFIRNHDNTYEFRFFSTCNHRLENIQCFFKYFFQLLDEHEPELLKNIILKMNEVEEITETISIPQENSRFINCRTMPEIYEFNVNLNSNEPVRPRRDPLDQLIYYQNATGVIDIDN